MGAQESSTHINNHHENKIQQQWEIIDHMSGYNIVQKNGHSHLGEIRKFELDPKYNINQEFEIYRMRNNTNQPIVAAYDVQKLDRLNKHKKGKPGLCASSNPIAVVTQRIPITLSQLKQVTFPESLYLLRQSIKGYQYLYPKTGAVHINDKMIGLNDKRKCKVWINEDWSSNHPNNEIKSLSSTRNLRLDKEYNLISPQFRDEKEMVENIIDVIEEKCQVGKFPPDFGGLLRANSRNFSNACKFIDGYIKDRNIIVPDQIHENLVRTNPEEIRKIQQRYAQYQNQYQQNISDRHINNNYHPKLSSLQYPNHHLQEPEFNSPQVFSTYNQTQNTAYPQSTYPQNSLLKNYQYNSSNSYNPYNPMHKETNVGFKSQSKKDYGYEISSLESKYIEKPKVNFGFSNY